MKTLFAVSGLALAIAGMPAVALAQETDSASAIVVTAKHQGLWDKGSKLEAKGLKELEAAKKKLISYSADVVDAQNKRDSSRSRAENASDEFRKLTSSVTYFSDPQEAARWARQVDKAATEWAKFDDRRGDGRQDLDKGVTRQRDAQKAVDKAQATVDRGRTMKAEAERLSRPRAGTSG